MATLDENGNVVKDEFGNEIWTIEKYQPNTIESLTESDLISHLTERLTLEEVLDVNLDENPILKPIAHTTIEELPGAIDSLTITQVFEKDVYKMNLSKTYFLDANDNRLYYNELDKAWYTTETFEAGTKSERVLVSTWKYLLKDATPEYVLAQDGAYVYNEESEKFELANESTPASAQRYQQKFTAPEAFKVNDIGALVENMTVNIQNASMQSLVDDKIITLSNDAILTQTIKYQFGVGPFLNSLEPFYREDGTVKETFGELTITEMLDYVAGILSLGL
jgi:hypothetical protein